MKGMNRLHALIEQAIKEELNSLIGVTDSGGPVDANINMEEGALEEESTSAATPGYLTPNAFQSGNGKEAIIRKHLGVDDKDFTPVPMGDKLHEAQSRYNRFKQEEGTTPQKIGRAIHEINKRLDEIDNILEMNQRLKTEQNLGSTGLWKRTTKHLTRMESKMLHMSHRIKELMS